MVGLNLISLLLIQAQPAATALDVRDPVALFKGVCLSDQVALPKSAVTESAYGQLPKGAREALGFSNPPAGIPRVQGPFALPPSEVPNRIVAVLPKKNAYLLLPAEGSAQYAAACAVVWRGNQYPKALEAVRSIGAIPNSIDLPLNAGLKGLNYSVFQVNGMVVGAAELSGWTVLRISPDLSPSTEQQPQ